MMIDNALFESIISLMEDLYDEAQEDVREYNSSFNEGKYRRLLVETFKDFKDGNPGTDHPMVVAYNALFDFKDTLDPTSQQFYRCYETLSHMALSMMDMGINHLIPQRYDAPR